MLKKKERKQSKAKQQHFLCLPLSLSPPFLDNSPIQSCRKQFNTQINFCLGGRKRESLSACSLRHPPFLLPCHISNVGKQRAPNCGPECLPRGGGAQRRRLSLLPFLSGSPSPAWRVPLVQKRQQMGEGGKREFNKGGESNSKLAGWGRGTDNALSQHLVLYEPLAKVAHQSGPPTLHGRPPPPPSLLNSLLFLLPARQCRVG